jgi:hypothetical protein
MHGGEPLAFPPAGRVAHALEPRTVPIMRRDRGGQLLDKLRLVVPHRRLGEDCQQDKPPPHVERRHLFLVMRFSNQCASRSYSKRLHIFR